MTPGIHILCIGISGYGFAPLTTAAVSALRVFEALLSLGSTTGSGLPIKSARLLVAPDAVEEKLVARLLPSSRATFAAAKSDATRRELDDVLNDWFEQARADPRDTTAFYFAGHGLGLQESPGQESKTLLLASDYEAEYTRPPRAITLEHVMGGLQPSRPADSVARQQLFLLDCCRTEAWHGPDAEQGNLTIRAADRTQAERHAPDDRRIAVQYACRARDRAWSSDNDVGRGDLVLTNYASALLSSLQRLAPLPELHVEYLLKHVAATLQQLHPHQEPRRGRADDFPLGGAGVEQMRPSAQVQVAYGTRVDSRAPTVLGDLATSPATSHVPQGTRAGGVPSESPFAASVAQTSADGAGTSSSKGARRWAVVAGSIAAGAALAVGAWKRGSQDSTIVPSATARPSAAALPGEPRPATFAFGSAPEGMVLVSGANIQPGSSLAEAEQAYRNCLEYGKDRGWSPAALPKELPCSRAFEASLFQRELRLGRSSRRIATFYLDRLEVTNRAYAAWLNTVTRDLVLQDAASGNTPWVALRGQQPLASVTTSTPRPDVRIRVQGDRFGYDAQASELPMAAVTWEGARRYCEGQGKRLPSELEWELAARGAERRELPWGASPATCPGVCFGRATPFDCASSPPGTAPAGSSPQDKTVLGIADLGGNVAEWTADAYVDAPPGEGPCTDDPSGSCRVIRGGSYLDPPVMLRAAVRTRLGAERSAPNVGFRCAKDAP